MDMTTWNKELARTRKDEYHSEVEDTSPIVAVAPKDVDLDKEFDGGYGWPEGKPVLIWTENYVYFPVVYDGAESLGRAPRNPTETGQEHFGGF